MDEALYYQFAYAVIAVTLTVLTIDVLQHVQSNVLRLLALAAIVLLGPIGIAVYFVTMRQRHTDS